MVQRILVTGAGGFIGHHLTERLRAEGCWVRGVDLHEPEYASSSAHEFRCLDLRRWENCEAAVDGIDEAYNLAADMGGIGYISEHHAQIARNSGLINSHMLEACHRAGVSRFLFTSSACVYPLSRQGVPEVAPLREEDAHPADPEEGYGWEKLYAEKLCEYYGADHPMETRIARLHNVYGPLGTYDGGREKAPAAICRKVAMARDGEFIDVWGDGQQTRSFLYVDDCVEGLLRLMRSDSKQPLNLGTERLVTIDALLDLVAGAAGKRVGRRYQSDRPQGVRGRNSDNRRLRAELRWEPATPLEKGIEITYRWIESEIAKAR